MTSSEFEDAYEADDQEASAFAEVFETPLSRLPLRKPLMIPATATVGDAIHSMNEHRTGCVLISRQGKLAGIFTERDVLRLAARPTDFHAIQVGSVMTANLETLDAEQDIASALNQMSVGGYRHIPIIDRDGDPRAVVSVRDIVDYLAERFPAQVLNLDPRSTYRSSAVDGG